MLHAEISLIPPTVPVTIDHIFGSPYRNRYEYLEPIPGKLTIEIRINKTEDVLKVLEALKSAGVNIDTP